MESFGIIGFTFGVVGVVALAKIILLEKNLRDLVF